MATTHFLIGKNIQAPIAINLWQFLSTEDANMAVETQEHSKYPLCSMHCMGAHVRSRLDRSVEHHTNAFR